MAGMGWAVAVQPCTNLVAPDPKKGYTEWDKLFLQMHFDIQSLFARAVTQQSRFEQTCSTGLRVSFRIALEVYAHDLR